MPSRNANYGISRAPPQHVARGDLFIYRFRRYVLFVRFCETSFRICDLKNYEFNAVRCRLTI